MCYAGEPIELAVGDEPTALYRLYNAEGTVIRIGITMTPAERMSNYGLRESWWPEVARGTMVWYPNRREACRAETLAIQAEEPKYNVRKRSSSGVSMIRLAAIRPEEKVKIIEDYLKERKADFEAGLRVELYPGGPGRQLFGKWSG